MRVNFAAKGDIMNSKHIRATVSVTVLMILSLSLFHVATAQTTTANIVGAISDTSGAVIPGVSVTATNTESGVARTVVTDSMGAYQLASVPAGIYDIEARGRGFSTGLRRRVSADLAATITVNFTLTV